MQDRDEVQGGRSASRVDSRMRWPARAGRRSLAALVAIAMASALAACAPGADGEPPTDADGTLDRFHSQALEWGACDDFAVTALDEQYFPLAPDAECARLLVPLDYAEPDGDTASVAVVRIAAAGDSVGPLLFNPGGPGGPGLLGAMGAWAGMAGTAIVERFDLIGFDPRGVGATQPAVDCYSEDGTTAGDAVFARLGTVAPTLDEEDTRALVDRCAEGTGSQDALANVGTRTTARDMDVLRAVLGAEKINFLGQSYGTRLGSVYAERFPDRVRAMILDGAFDPTLGKADRLVASYAGFQAAFETMAAACAAQADCPLGVDPAAWTTTFQTIVQPLGETPVPALDDELDFDLALGGVMSGLYSPDTWPTIIEGLREIQNGRGDTLLALTEAFAGTDAEGVSTNQSEALFAINCVDEALLTSSALEYLRERAFTQAPFMDSGVAAVEGTRDQCADWPRTGELGTPYGVDIDGLPTVLVVSLTGDATTPHPGGIALAETLGARLLTVNGEGHTVISQNLSDCATAIAADYLVALTLPDGELTCTL